MNHTTIEFRPTKRDRATKSLIGALAALATVATLGLMVVAPASAPPGDAVLARRVAPAPIEVAIVPSSIQVTATRARVARHDGEGRFMPATYRTR